MSEREISQRAAMRAIHALLQRVRWKPHKDIQHLAKRKAMGHLPENATMDDYNALVVAILNVGKNLVYRYSFGARDYYAVSGQAKGLPWLVIFDRDGIMETAFPPNDLATYLEKRGFVLLGRMQEITHE